MTARRPALTAALVAALSACASRDTVAVLAAHEASSSSGGGSSGGGSSSSGGAPIASFCQGSSPPVLIDGTCTGLLAERFFGRAACTCGALSLGADLATDSFDSRVAPWTANGTGGDVGAEGGLSSNGTVRVGGSLAVSGGSLQAAATLHVGADLEVAGALGRPYSAVTVGGSARIGGDVDVGSLSVSGSLTTAPAAALSGAIRAGTAATGTVTVAAACPCGAALAVDVAAIVAQHQATNDNGSIGLSPGALSMVSAPATLSLPCGRFYLDAIGGGASVTLRATGRAALFVGAGISPAGPLAIELAPGAELDLFVAGPVNLPASVALGDMARPSALRMWLSTNGTVFVPFGARVAASLYAPNAELAVHIPLDLYGAVMVRQIVNSGPLSIHHDRAIAAAAAACGQ